MRNLQIVFAFTCALLLAGCLDDNEPEAEGFTTNHPCFQSLLDTYDMVLYDDEELDECADYIVLYIYENEPWFSIESPCAFINVDPNPTDCSSTDPCIDDVSCEEFFEKAISRGIVAYRE